MTIILGLDPSLSCTGWGVIRAEGSRLSHIANGQIATDAKAPIPERLAQLQRELSAVIAQHARLDAWLSAQGVQREGYVGAARCRLVKAAHVIESTVELMRVDGTYAHRFS